MKTKIPLLPVVLLSIIFFQMTNNSFAQCAMCKAVAESAQDENTIRTGLNSGILYLLAVPYLMIAGFTILFFRKQLKEFFRKWQR